MERELPISSFSYKRDTCLLQNISAIPTTLIMNLSYFHLSWDPSSTSFTPSQWQTTYNLTWKWNLWALKCQLNLYIKHISIQQPSKCFTQTNGYFKTKTADDLTGCCWDGGMESAGMWLYSGPTWLCPWPWWLYCGSVALCMGCTNWGACGTGPFTVSPLTAPADNVNFWVLTCCMVAWRTVGGVISLGGVNLTNCKVHKRSVHHTCQGSSLSIQ